MKRGIVTKQREREIERGDLEEIHQVDTGDSKQVYSMI